MRCYFRLKEDGELHSAKVDNFECQQKGEDKNVSWSFYFRVEHNGTKYVVHDYVLMWDERHGDLNEERNPDLVEEIKTVDKKKGWGGNKEIKEEKKKKGLFRK